MYVNILWKPPDRGNFIVIIKAAGTNTGILVQNLKKQNREVFTDYLGNFTVLNVTKL